MLRGALTFAVLSAVAASGLHAETPAPLRAPVVSPALDAQLVELTKSDAQLMSARANSPDCEAGCITPSEALKMAFEAGEGVARRGRFLLDIKGGGQSLSGTLDQLFFVSSRQDYARFGTLTIAFEEDALWALLRRAKVCGSGEVTPGQIDVKGCRRDANFDLNIFTMIERLGNRRIIVDGEVRLQWIDARTGLPRPVANIRGEHEEGYYQVWVRVEDADQVLFFYED